MKKLLAIAVLGVTCSAQAQILPFALGVAVSPSGSTKNPPNTSLALISQEPSRDVIVCLRSGIADEKQECEVEWGVFSSASDYSKKMGYTKIHRKGVAFVDRKSFVVMEVSR